MLERLELFDFQCHERFAVDLDPKVTVFVGPSDSGKTAAAFRSLRWLAFNRPRGDGLIRHGSDTVKVRLTLDGGRKIVRSKGKENLYKLDGERYVAFGSDVPGPIVDLLNADDVNFSGQLDSPWWFLKSPGEVSKELNQIVDLGLIDRTMSNLAAKHRQAEAGVKIYNERLIDAEARVAASEWVPDCQADMDELERVTAELERVRERAARIATLLKRMQESAEGVRTLGRAVNDAAKAVHAASAWRDKTEEAERIRYHLDKISKSKRERAEARAAAQKASASLKAATKGRCPVCGKVMKG